MMANMRKGGWTMSNSRDDLVRHREWLEGMIADRAWIPVFERGDATYVVRLANPRSDLVDVVSNIVWPNGGTVSFGTGFFEGQVEPDAAITIQCDEVTLSKLVRGLALEYPLERFLHIERHEPMTWYADMTAIREDDK